MASETKERERKERVPEETDTPYRGDREADHARIASLEGELAQANARIAELEGKRSQALVLAGSKDLAATGKAKTASAKWFGAPLKLELTQTWDTEFPLDKLEDLLDVIREATGDSGRVELLKTSMTWWSSSPEKGTGPFIEVRISVRDGKTRLEVKDRLGQLAGVIYGAIGGGVGGGAIMLPIGASIAVPILAPVFALAWLGGGYFGLRKLFKSRARKRAESLQRVFERVSAEIAKKS
ncbi:MAG TPA: hypothetical protein VMZ53_14150 [Kofleriaceae bacterium]|nr:hypothetical protein [Kofleriaceae bacterium]